MPKECTFYCWFVSMVFIVASNISIVYYFKSNIPDYLLLNTSEYMTKYSTPTPIIYDVFKEKQSIIPLQHHICLNKNGLYSPLPSNYYHNIYNKSLEYKFQCPYNSCITSIRNTISHLQFRSNDDEYFTFIPIIIPFIAYDINNNPQQYGGDEFMIYTEYEINDKRIAFQTFPVQDLLNGTYLIHLLLSIPGIYTVSMLHKFSCFEAMINNKNPIDIKEKKSMDFKHLIIFKVLDYNKFHQDEFEYDIDHKMNDSKYCELNENTINMLSSGIWSNDNVWTPFCIEWHNNKYCKPYCCKMRLNGKKLNGWTNNKYIQFKIGDSTLFGRTHEIGDQYRNNDTFYKLINNQQLFRKNINNKTILLATNPNFNAIKQNVNLYKACNESMKLICHLIYYLNINHIHIDIDVVIVGGTAMYNQLFKSIGLLTQYRVRWHDECIKKKINIINSIRRRDDILYKNNDINICGNHTLNNKLFALKKDIWFIDISAITMARWTVNKYTPRDLYQYAMLLRGAIND